MARKILFLIPALTTGGAEQNLLRFLKQSTWSKHFEYSVALIRKENKFEHELPECVRVYYLYGFIKYNALVHIIKLYKIIKKLQPDVVVSYFLYCHIGALVCNFLCKIPFLNMFSIRVSAWHGQKHEKLGWLRIGLLRLLYKKADYLLAIAFNMKEELKTKFGIPEEQIGVVFNSIDFGCVRGKIKENVSHPYFDTGSVIISAGRLVKQKGFDVLLKAAALLKDSVSFKLIIMGDGKEKNNLLSLANNLNLTDSVSLVGFQENPYAWMNKADIFVLPSRWEGLPNALMDAMTCGLAVIACDCPTGPRDLIKNGENGYLVPVDDVDTMASTIKNLLENTPLRARLGQYAKESVQKYSVENIGRQFESLLLKLTNY